jgi:hypothetical protein
VYHVCVCGVPALRVAALQTLVRAFARIPQRSHLFFKLTSFAVRYIQLFVSAFPESPWVFMYRTAVETMAANFHNRTLYGPCSRYRDAPPADILALLPNANIASAERYCAAFIAHLRMYALGAVASSRTKHSPKGTVINYRDMPDVFIGALCLS